MDDEVSSMPSSPLVHTTTTTTSTCTNSPILPSLIPHTSLDRCRRTQLTYGTVYGHMLAGQESMCVCVPTHTHTMDNIKQPVVMTLCSLAKGYGLLGRMVEPLISPLQRKFLMGHLQSSINAHNHTQTHTQGEHTTPAFSQPIFMEYRG